MTLAWPLALTLLLLVPLAVWGFATVDLQRSARRRALGASVGATVEPTAGRLIAPSLMLLALVLAIVTLARPHTTIDVPSWSGRVVLAFDTSASMAATDVSVDTAAGDSGDDPDDRDSEDRGSEDRDGGETEATRLDLATSTARSFVANAPDNLEIAVVSFSTSGLVTMRPTDVRADVLAAIDRLRPAGDTAISQGLLAALDAGADSPLRLDDSAGGTPDEAIAPDTSTDGVPPLDLDDFGSAIIIVFSDGEDTTETNPLPIAELAGSAGIRIDTVGIGTIEGAVLELDGFSVSTALAEEQLQAIAATANGTYQRADESLDLDAVYDDVERSLRIDAEETEITGLFALAALIVAALAAAAGFLRDGRLV